MLSRRRYIMYSLASLVLVATLACQPPAGPAAGGVSTLEEGLSDAPASGASQELASGSSAASGGVDSDLGEVDAVDDPFGLIAPTFQSIGIQSHSTTCDPFDEAYGTCL